MSIRRVINAEHAEMCAITRERLRDIPADRLGERMRQRINDHLGGCVRCATIVGGALGAAGASSVPAVASGLATAGTVAGGTGIAGAASTAGSVAAGSASAFSALGAVLGGGATVLVVAGGVVVGSLLAPGLSSGTVPASAESISVQEHLAPPLNDVGPVTIDVSGPTQQPQKSPLPDPPHGPLETNPRPQEPLESESEGDPENDSLPDAEPEETEPEAPVFDVPETPLPPSLPVPKPPAVPEPSPPPSEPEEPGDDGAALLPEGMPLLHDDTAVCRWTRGGNPHDSIRLEVPVLGEPASTVDVVLDGESVEIITLDGDGNGTAVVRPTADQLDADAELAVRYITETQMGPLSSSLSVRGLTYPLGQKCSAEDPEPSPEPTPEPPTEELFEDELGAGDNEDGSNDGAETTPSEDTKGNRQQSPGHSDERETAIDGQPAEDQDTQRHDPETQQLASEPLGRDESAMRGDDQPEPHNGTLP